MRSLGDIRPAALLSLVLLVMVSACGSSSTASHENGQPLNIVTFNPFSGPDASFGPELHAGCPPAAAVIATAGGVLGHKTILCPTVDTRGDPADAVPAASNAIATIPNLVGVMGPTSDEASATVPIFEAAHIPMFASTGQPSFDQTSYQYFWRMLPSDDSYGYAMAKYAIDKGYRHAALVFGNDIGSQGTVPTVTKGFTKLGGTIAINQVVVNDQSSYRTEVLGVVNANPDVIISELDPQSSATYFGELKQLHGLYPLVLTAATYQPWLDAVTQTVGAAYLSNYYADVFGASPPATGPAYEQYNTNLLASGSQIDNAPQYSTDLFAEAGYDSVIVMCLAMLAAGTTNPTVWNSYIYKVTTAGSGATIVHTFQEGKDALAAGKTIAYEGATGQIAFDKWHNSLQGFGVYGFGAKEGAQPVILTYSPADIAAISNK